MNARHAAPTDANDLAETLALSLLLRTGKLPDAVVVHGGRPDMDTRAELFNEGFQTAHAWDVVEEPEADDSTDRVERMVEQAPDPVVFMHDGEVVAALILMPGWSFHRPQMNLTREGRGQLIVKRRER